MVVVVAAIVFLESGRRKVPVQYAKRVIGRTSIWRAKHAHSTENQYSGSDSAYFRIVDYRISCDDCRVFRDALDQGFGAQLAPGSLLYTLMYVGLILFFCFFYTAVVLNPVDMADNMKKYGGFIPGIRPGTRTSDYIYKVLTRITFAGSIYLAIVCVIPEFLIYKLNVPFYFGGTSLLIVIGVGLDTAQQIESHMLMRNYEGFLGKGMAPLRGRSG